MPWGSSLFPLLIVTSSGRFTGLFVYSPAPGNGNLIASITASSGTDPFGNAFNAGITSYTHGGGLLINMLAGVLNFGDTLSADALTSLGLMRIIHMAAHGAQPIVAIDAPAADTNTTHSSLWLLGAPQGYTSGPVQAAFFADNATGGSAGQSPLDVIVCPGAGGSLTFGAISAITGTPAGNTMKWLAPSSDTTGATDAAALTHAYGVGNYQHVFLLPGTYYLNGTVTLGPGQYLRGAGRSATIIKAGSGLPASTAMVKLFSAGGSNIHQMAGVSDVSIDGTGSTNCTGVQFGDISEIALHDVAAYSFGGGNAVGFLGLSTVNFSEQLHGLIYSIDNDQCLTFTNGGTGTGSFDRMNLDAYIRPNSGGFGVVFKTGAMTLDGRLSIRGNFPAGGTCLLLNSAQIGKGFQLDIGVEANGAPSPQTISFTNPTDTIDAYGSMDFIASPTAWTASNNNGNLNFLGKISGDTSLLQKVRQVEWAPVTTGFPAGWTGTITWRSNAEAGDVTMFWNFTIAATTVVTDGQAVHVAPSAQFFNPNHLIQTAAHLVFGGGLTPVFGGLQIATTGAINYFGQGFTVGGSSAFFTGQITYNNTI